MLFSGVKQEYIHHQIARRRGIVPLFFFLLVFVVFEVLVTPIELWTSGCDRDVQRQLLGQRKLKVYRQNH